MDVINAFISRINAGVINLLRIIVWFFHSRTASTKNVSMGSVGKVS